MMVVMMLDADKSSDRYDDNEMLLMLNMTLMTTSIINHLLYYVGMVQL